MKLKLETVVEDLISHSHEEEWFEFKVNWFEPHALGEYISAMSNAAALIGHDRAYFVWGVENDSHEIIGTLFNYHLELKGEPLKHYLARKIRPDIGFEFHEIMMAGKRVVVLIIPSACNTPTAFDKVRYLRIGSGKVNLMEYPERESQLFHVLRHGLPTIVNTKSEYQNLAFNKLLVYYEAKGIALNKKTFRKNLGFYTEDGEYNLLAQLLSDNSHIPIRFGLFTGINKASTMYSVREFGNTCLLYSLDDVLRYGDVLNIPQADERNRVVERKEVMLFDQSAFREAVINAFVHNRWVDGNGPMFNGFRDKIEILSRGNLPPNQTMEGFFAGESVPVNKRLSDIFLQLHISERTGRGVPRITEVYGRDRIKFNENSIVVTIPFDRLDDEFSDAEESENENVGPADAPVSTPVGPADTPVSTPVGPADTPVDTPVDTLDDGRNSSRSGHGLQFGPKEEIEEKILSICAEPRGILAIAASLGFRGKKSVRRYLIPLIDQGRIAMTIPDKPTSRFQKYVTIK